MAFSNTPWNHGPQAQNSASLQQAIPRYFPQMQAPRQTPLLPRPSHRTFSSHHSQFQPRFHLQTPPVGQPNPLSVASYERPTSQEPAKPTFIPLQSSRFATQQNVYATRIPVIPAASAQPPCSFKQKTQPTNNQPLGQMQMHASLILSKAQHLTDSIQQDRVTHPNLVNTIGHPPRAFTQQSMLHNPRMSTQAAKPRASPSNLISHLDKFQSHSLPFQRHATPQTILPRRISRSEPPDTVRRKQCADTTLIQQDKQKRKAMVPHNGVEEESIIPSTKKTTEDVTNGTNNDTSVANKSSKCSTDVAAPSESDNPKAAGKADNIEEEAFVYEDFPKKDHDTLLGDLSSKNPEDPPTMLQEEQKVKRIKTGNDPLPNMDNFVSDKEKEAKRRLDLRFRRMKKYERHGDNLIRLIRKHGGQIYMMECQRLYRKEYGTRLCVETKRNSKEFVNEIMPAYISIVTPEDGNKHKVHPHWKVLQLRESDKEASESLILSFKDHIYPSVVEALGFKPNEGLFKPFTFDKEKLACPEYQRKGRCTYNHCALSHKYLPASFKICKRFYQGRCRSGDRCKLLHGPKPTENSSQDVPGPKFAKSPKLCYNFLETGKCRYKNKCWYTHKSKDQITKDQEEEITKRKKDQEEIPKRKTKKRKASKELSRSFCKKRKKAQKQSKKRKTKKRKTEQL